jgi:hypothetical protein
LKSFCASVAFPAFQLGHDPTRRVICVSYSGELARKHSNDCRALMASSKFRRLFKNTRISASKDTELEVMSTERGFRLATSVGGTLTGRAGNLIIIDDPMKPQDAHSRAARGNLLQWYSNTLLSRLDNKARDAIIVVMQRLHSDDLVGHLLREGGWTHLNLPAIAEVEEQIQLGPNRFHVRKVGDLLHSERESQAVLDQIKRSMGLSEFTAQFQQAPVPPGGNMVKWAWFRPPHEQRQPIVGCAPHPRGTAEAWYQGQPGHGWKMDAMAVQSPLSDLAELSAQSSALRRLTCLWLSPRRFSSSMC